jgi:hypothetical protein
MDKKPEEPKTLEEVRKRTNHWPGILLVIAAVAAGWWWLSTHSLGVRLTP